MTAVVLGFRSESVPAFPGDQIWDLMQAKLCIILHNMAHIMNNVVVLLQNMIVLSIKMKEIFDTNIAFSEFAK